MPKHRIIITETTESAYVIEADTELDAMQAAVDDHMYLRNTRVWFHVADRVVEVGGDAPRLTERGDHDGN